MFPGWAEYSHYGGGSRSAGLVSPGSSRQHAQHTPPAPALVRLLQSSHTSTYSRGCTLLPPACAIQQACISPIPHGTFGSRISGMSFSLIRQAFLILGGFSAYLKRSFQKYQVVTWDRTCRVKAWPRLSPEHAPHISPGCALAGTVAAAAASHRHFTPPRLDTQISTYLPLPTQISTIYIPL